MTENTSGRKSGDNNFEELCAAVVSRLDDPAYIEHINTIFIIERTIDGQRKYPKWMVESSDSEMDDAIKEGFTFEPEDIRSVLGNGLTVSTNNFQEQGSYRVEGREVLNIVDIFLQELAERDIDPEDIDIMLEGLISGAIGIGSRKPFCTYQTDITVSGQGLIEDTYFLDVQFRPIPKNLES